MFPFCSVCMCIFTLLISQEKKSFWILALRQWECRAAFLCLEMNGKKPQVESLFSYLSQPSFFSSFQFAEYASFILLCMYEEGISLPLPAGKWCQEKGNCLPMATKEVVDACI